MTSLRRSMKLAILIAVMVVVAACAPPPTGETTVTTEGGTDTTAGSDTTVPSGDTTTAPTAEGGGTIVVGRTGDIDNLDPHLATAFQTIDALELVYDSLTELDAELNVQPGLASEWEYNDDGTELTFHLREGVTFHDGQPLTSADVVASLERILDEATGAVVRTNLLSISEIAAPDDLTVVLTLSVPDATLPAALTDLNTAILSAESIENGSAATEPNGTGPFSFVNWTQGQEVELDAFDDYWGEGPFVEGILIRVVPEEQSMLAALQAGEVHLGVMGN
ncbi:MAG: ABC transporter substrate-binding protein, partial [Acidimicrobiia bacterium]